MRPAEAVQKADFDMMLTEQGRSIVYKRTSGTTFNPATGQSSETATDVTLLGIAEALSKDALTFGSFQGCDMLYRFKADSLAVSGTPFAPSSADSIVDGSATYAVVKAILDPSGIEWQVGVTRTV